MNTPKISVIIPIYNTEKYLDKCLSSVSEQSFKDIEIICINDGSTDSSLKILKQWANKDTRIKIINQKNGGPSKARNEGLKIARGEYIAFIDSDDYVNKIYLEKLYNAVISKNCDMAISNMARKHKYLDKYRFKFDGVQVYKALQEKIDICKVPVCCYACGKLFKTSVIKESFFEEGLLFEDIFWLPEIIKLCDKIVTVPESYYYYIVNRNSIVKTNVLKKRQNDLYIARKLFIKFADDNNLKISKRTRNITKNTKFLLGIPILKTKDCEGKISRFLFSCIKIPNFIANLYDKLQVIVKQIFSLSSIDSHIAIYIFGIQIRKKYSVLTKDISISQNGLNENSPRKQRIIASLTTFPERIKTVEKTIKTLLNQTIKPDELILWLAQSQFPNKENDLPESLLGLKKYGLSIKWCNDIKSYKKLIPALKEYPDDVIITFDDDIYYDNDVIQNLYYAYLLEPKMIHTNRGHRVYLKGNNLKNVPNAQTYWLRYDKPSFKNTIIGCGGTLYPPHLLSSEVFNEAKFMSFIPTQDDIWFWAMALLNKTKINVVSSYDMQIKTVENTQNVGLCKVNKIGKKGINGKNGFELISSLYPEIKEIIKEENQNV